MTTWAAFTPLMPLSPEDVRRHWPRLHGGDGEPLPDDVDLFQAWALYHRGDFEAAYHAGVALSARGKIDGLTVATRAISVYANYLEPGAEQRLRLFEQAVAHATVHTEQQPDNPNAWFTLAYGLGRHAQSVSVTKSMALGLGKRIRLALDRALALNPNHADAHLALATFHAEVIDKLGEMVGAITYGVNRAVGLSLYERAQQLNPGSLIGMLETARGLMMLAPQDSQERANLLYQQLRVARALDAFEALVVGLANATDD